LKKDFAKEIFETLDRGGRGYLSVRGQKVTCLDFCRFFNVKVPFVAQRFPAKPTQSTSKTKDEQKSISGLDIKRSPYFPAKLGCETVLA